MNKKFYLTTAIPYVNARPHIGHALEFVQADCVARYHKLLGEAVTLLSGADENSLKNVQAAEKEGLTTQKLCDRNSLYFQNLAGTLNVSFDIFQRATEEKHFKSSQKLWQLCEKSGDIYKKSYTGLYCVGCEVFYTEDELENGLCPEHKVKPETISEENHFFKLQKYQKQLEKLIASDQLQITPETRKNEALGFIRSGLTDFSISRTLKRAKGWGVPVPKDPDQIMYVWFDALNIYQTGVGFNWNEEHYKKWWPADLHVIGKGILRFHAVYWPAILLSAGLPLPKSLFVHGYVTAEGQKMSKSLGNVIDPFDLVKKYGTDPVRYYLLREIPAYGDGDFSERRFKEIYNADLANGLGNLVARVAKLASQAKIKLVGIDLDWPSQNPKITKYIKFLDEYQFNEALSFVWAKITETNREIDAQKPWELKGNKLEEVLTSLCDKILEITILLKPFLPETAEKIQKQFIETQIKAGPPLFPRL